MLNIFKANLPVTLLDEGGKRITFWLRFGFLAVFQWNDSLYWRDDIINGCDFLRLENNKYIQINTTLTVAEPNGTLSYSPLSDLLINAPLESRWRGQLGVRYWL